MTIVRLWIRIFLMALFLIGNYLALNAQDKVKWEYPINPSSIEWKNLETYAEQLQAYNIPSEIIKKISTEELVKTCLSYPEWRLINAYTNRHIGLSNIIALFNGFNELFLRDDAAKELIRVYVQMDPKMIDLTWSSLQKGIFSFQFVCIEMLLSHRAIIMKLDSTDIRLLMDEAVSKYKNMAQASNFYSLWDLSPVAGLCLSILDKDGVFINNYPDLRFFQRTFMTEDIATLNRIIELSQNH
jgi:hypothetical protein